MRYLLEGSVKRAGDRVRVTAQLVDARTGGHVWAEQYDRPLGDIFAVQDEVTAAIAARLGATIERAEADLARRKAPADLGAYDYYLQGRVKRLTSDKAQLLEARELFRKAVALDPGFAPAYAELAHSYYTEVALRWDPPRREEALAEGFALARKAIELDPTLPLAHLTMGNLHLRRHDYDEAAGWAERAVALGPSDPENYAGLANIYSFMGRAADALALMRKAVELDPNYPPRYGMYLGRAYLFTRQPEAAVPHLRDAASRAPDYWPAHLLPRGRVRAPRPARRGRRRPRGGPAADEARLAQGRRSGRRLPGGSGEGLLPRGSGARRPAAGMTPIGCSTALNGGSKGFRLGLATASCAPPAPRTTKRRCSAWRTTLILARADAWMLCWPTTTAKSSEHDDRGVPRAGSRSRTARVAGRGARNRPILLLALDVCR